MTRYALDLSENWACRSSFAPPVGSTTAGECRCCLGALPGRRATSPKTHSGMWWCPRWPARPIAYCSKNWPGLGKKQKPEPLTHRRRGPLGHRYQRRLLQLRPGCHRGSEVRGSGQGPQAGLLPPPPQPLFQDFLQRVDKVLVVEELEPYLEEGIRGPWPRA